MISYHYASLKTDVSTLVVDHLSLWLLANGHLFLFFSQFVVSLSHRQYFAQGWFMAVGLISKMLLSLRSVCG